MNIEQLRKELEVDEGVKYEIYNDHLGFPTFGIGHLVRDDDPEDGEPVGTPVSSNRVIEAFNEDVETVLSDCAILYDDFDDLPEEAQLIIANMMFNLGRPRLSKLKRPQRKAAKIEEKIRRFKEAALMVGRKDDNLNKELGMMLGGRVKNSGMRKKAKSKR